MSKYVRITLERSYEIVERVEMLCKLDDSDDPKDIIDIIDDHNYDADGSISGNGFAFKTDLLPWCLHDDHEPLEYIDNGYLKYEQLEKHHQHDDNMDFIKTEVTK